MQRPLPPLPALDWLCSVLFAQMHMENVQRHDVIAAPINLIGQDVNNMCVSDTHLPVLLLHHDTEKVSFE